MNFLRRWRQFIVERFPLTAQLPLIAAFVVGNQSLAGSLSVESALVGFCVCLLFFLRLRLFDEIKDFAHDRTRNPQRPLPRGLISVDEVRVVLLGIIVIEMGLVWCFAPDALPGYLITFAFSILMFNEFFMRKRLRRHLTTYAVLHTFVAALLANFVAALGTALDVQGGQITLGALNWALFNLYEFSRKTYAPAEERALVETYSGKFGPQGALALALSQVVLVPLLLAWGGLPSIAGVTIILQVMLGVAFAGQGALYLLLATPRAARLYRVGAGIYLLLVYLVCASNFAGP